MAPWQHSVRLRSVPRSLAVLMHSVTCLLCSHSYDMKVACYLGNTRPIANSAYLDKKFGDHRETIQRLKCFEDLKESLVSVEPARPKQLERTTSSSSEDLAEARVVTHLCSWENSANDSHCDFQLRCYTVGQVGCCRLLIVQPVDCAWCSLKLAMWR